MFILNTLQQHKRGLLRFNYITPFLLVVASDFFLRVSCNGGQDTPVYLGCYYPYTLFSWARPKNPSIVVGCLYAQGVVTLTHPNFLGQASDFFSCCGVYICLGFYYPCTPSFPRPGLRFLQLLDLAQNSVNYASQGVTWISCIGSFCFLKVQFDRPKVYSCLERSF